MTVRTCASCGRPFTSVAAFDRHLSAPPTCGQLTFDSMWPHRQVCTPPGEAGLVWQPKDAAARNPEGWTAPRRGAARPQKRAHTATRMAHTRPATKRPHRPKGEA